MGRAVRGARNGLTCPARNEDVSYSTDPAAARRRESARDPKSGEFGPQSHSDPGEVPVPCLESFEAGWALKPGRRLQLAEDDGIMQALSDPGLRSRLARVREAGALVTVTETTPRRRDEPSDVGAMIELGDGGAPVELHFHRESYVTVQLD